MKLSSTLFLRLMIILIGALVAVICVVALPQTIGTFQMWGYDPILLCLYIPAVPFFYALYQAMKLLSLIDTNKAFSIASVESLRKIKFCAAIISVLFTVSMPYVFYLADTDDAPGVVLIGLVIIFISIIVATFAGVLQKLIQSAVEIKSENDLTV